MKTSGTKFKKHILIPLSIAFLLLLSVSIVHTYRLQRLNIVKEAETNFDKVQQTVFSGLSQNSRILNEIIDMIMRNKTLENAWIDRNQAEILRNVKPMIENYPINKEITHLYFIDLNSICFLRVHKPESCGDIINRFTLGQAIRKVASASGIELGPFGTLTFRVVRPWWISGRLTGYIEAGIEIEHIVTELKNNLGSDIILTVGKAYLERSKWEEGFKMLGRTGDWNRFPNFVVVDQTLATISSKLEKYIKLHADQDEKHVFNFSLEDRNYRVGFIPLIDAGERRLGDIIVLKDITKKEIDLHIQVLSLVIASAVIGVLMFGFFYFYVGRIERGLINSHNALKDEIAERKQIEKSLQESRDRLEIRVQERTADLRRANEQLQLELKERKQAEEEIRVLSQQLFNVIEDERKKLALDLHDEFGQALTMLRLNMETLQVSLPDTLKKEKEKCRDLIRLVERQCETINNIVSDLRPDMLDHLGFVPTLKWYIQEFVKQSQGLTIDFQTIGIQTRSDPETEIILYRILQESLTNISKHAKAKHVQITLTYSHPNLIFVIRDDGVGFEHAEIKQYLGKTNPGVGLIGMRERIAAKNGVIDIRSDKGKGTVIRVELPLTLKTTKGKDENFDSRRS